MSAPTRTRLAILGTVSDLHREPIGYDLDCLRRVVAEAAPDLLCAEITPDAWEQEDFSQATLEVREALAPIISATDIVLIPVAPSQQQYADFEPELGWRRRLVRSLDRLLRWGQIQADEVQTVNGPWFGAFCHTVCWVTETLWSPKDRAAWRQQNQELADNIVEAVRRDSGRRVLAAVQCQRLHHLMPLLRDHRELFDLVPYQNL